MRSILGHTVKLHGSSTRVSSILRGVLPNHHVFWCHNGSVGLSLTRFTDFQDNGESIVSPINLHVEDASKFWATEPLLGKNEICLQTTISLACIGAISPGIMHKKFLYKYLDGDNGQNGATASDQAWNFAPSTTVD